MTGEAVWARRSAGDCYSQMLGTKTFALYFRIMLWPDSAGANHIRKVPKALEDT